MKVCKDCRHWQKNPMTTASGNYDRCLRPGAAWASVDLIRGEHRPAYAEHERTYTSKPGACGLEGQHWEPCMDEFTSTEQEASHVEP